MTVFSRPVSRYQFIYNLVDTFIIAKSLKLAELYSIDHLHPPSPLLCHPSLIFLDLFPSPSSTVPPPPPPSFSLLGISFPLYTLQPSPSSSLLCEFPSPFIHNILTPPLFFPPFSLVPFPYIPPSSHIS